MKLIISSILKLFLRLILNVPSFTFRNFIYKKVFKSYGENTNIFLGLCMKEPKNILIGNNCVINKNCLIDGRGGQLTIEDNVDIAQEVQIWTLDHDPNCDLHSTRKKPVVVKKNSWICVRSIILPGVTIGEGAVVAANSVVTKDVKPFTIVGGSPAKFIANRKSMIKYKLSHFEYFE